MVLDKKVKVIRTLKSKIEKIAHTKELMSDRLVLPGLGLLSLAHHWKPHFSDVKIYLKSCVGLQLNSEIPDAFLVSDDHIIFNFLQSKVISELFQECITQELETCIPVKLGVAHS